MKKLMLSAIAFAAMMCATAQNPITPVEVPKVDLDAIPSIFSNGSFAFCQHFYHIPGEDVYTDTVDILNSDFQIEKTFLLNLGVRPSSGDEIQRPTRLWFDNYDAEMYDIMIFYISQTLFNNDAKFEYIRPVYASNEMSDYPIERFEILSDDGSVVNTITWDEGYLADNSYVYLIKFGNKCYLRIGVSNGTVYKQAWYRIDRQTQSIARVDNVPFNVFPTVAERGRDITVQIEEGTNAREIVVVDAMGREVKSVPVAQGQREVKINTSDLGHGMGFISDRKNGAVKIIVR